MAGFSAKLDELRQSSVHLRDAADAAEAARNTVAGHDVPMWDPHSDDGNDGGGIFDDMIPSPPPKTPFGSTLSMPGFANAYEGHRRKVQELIEQLHANTVATSVALANVADLYEAYEVETHARLRKSQKQLDEN